MTSRGQRYRQSLLSKPLVNTCRPRSPSSRGRKSLVLFRRRLRHPGLRLVLVLELRRNPFPLVLHRLLRVLVLRVLRQRVPVPLPVVQRGLSLSSVLLRALLLYKLDGGDILLSKSDIRVPEICDTSTDYKKADVNDSIFKHQ